LKVLSALDLSAHPGLGGVELTRRSSNVQAVLVNRDEVSQLLELHSA
jgi:hypothetical protein